jgi:hypothetical protein
MQTNGRTDTQPDKHDRQRQDRHTTHTHQTDRQTDRHTETDRQSPDRQQTPDRQSDRQTDRRTQAHCAQGRAGPAATEIVNELWQAPGQPPQFVGICAIPRNTFDSPPQKKIQLTWVRGGNY